MTGSMGWRDGDAGRDRIGDRDGEGDVEGGGWIGMDGLRWMHRHGWIDAQGRGRMGMLDGFGWGWMD